MRVLVLSQYFWPETFIINSLAKILADQGHQVHVFTGKPNYPEGVIFPGYNSSGLVEELYAGQIPVFRIPLRPRGRGAKGLILNYFSFVINGLWYFPKFLRKKDSSYDAILVYAPSPILSVLPAILLRWKTKAHLAVWVQDLWPETLSATGFVTNRVLLWLVGRVVKLIYTFSDTILIQSRAFKSFVARYADSDKIIYYPNCYSLGPEAAICDEKKVSDELLEFMDHNFCVVFAGNLGAAQSLDTLVAAAVKLRVIPECKIVVVGSGSKSAWLAKQKIDLALDNILLVGRFPSSEMHKFFARSSALLVTLSKSDVFSLTVPSKIQAYLAAGRPIIAALDGEGARIVEEAGAGLCCPSEDASGLACSIEKLFNMSAEKRDEMGRAGLRYFIQNFEVNNQAKKLIEILTVRIASKEGSQ